MKILNTCEWEDQETAEQLTWDAENCIWNKKKTTVRVMSKLFASGKKYGCLLIYNVDEQMVYVLKAGLGIYEHNATDNVRTQHIAQNVAEKLNAENPATAIHILPCWLYVLNQRDRMPAVRVEPLIVGAYGKLDLRDCDSASGAIPLQHPAEELEAVKLFELFSFHESDHRFILWNPLRIGDSTVVYWTEPGYFRHVARPPPPSSYLHAEANPNANMGHSSLDFLQRARGANARKWRCAPGFSFSAEFSFHFHFRAAMPSPASLWTLCDNPSHRMLWRSPAAGALSAPAAARERPSGPLASDPAASTAPAAGSTEARPRSTPRCSGSSATASPAPPLTTAPTAAGPGRSCRPWTACRCTRSRRRCWSRCVSFQFC